MRTVSRFARLSQRAVAASAWHRSGSATRSSGGVAASAPTRSSTASHSDASSDTSAADVMSNSCTDSTTAPCGSHAEAASSDKVCGVAARRGCDAGEADANDGGAVLAGSAATAAAPCPEEDSSCTSGVRRAGLFAGAALPLRAPAPPPGEVPSAARRVSSSGGSSRPPASRAAAAATAASASGPVAAAATAALVPRGCAMRERNAAKSSTPAALACSSMKRAYACGASRQRSRYQSRRACARASGSSADSSSRKVQRAAACFSAPGGRAGSASPPAPAALVAIFALSDAAPRGLAHAGRTLGRFLRQPPTLSPLL